MCGVQATGWKGRLCLLACVLAATPLAAVAGGGVGKSLSGTEWTDPARLTAYEDNFAIWNQMRNNAWTGKDEQALRARISFKFTFCGPQFRRSTPARAPASSASQPASSPTGHGEPEPTSTSTWCPTSELLRDAELYFGYTSEFDFYAGTRPSGPVIGRVNAPGFFVRMPASKVLPGNWRESDGLELGLQHRSDGQATEVVSARDARIANQQYADANHPYFDTVSRGANYWLVAADKALDTPSGSDSLHLRAKLRLYIGRQDSDITWGPLAGSGRRFSDYDRLELQTWWRLRKSLQFDLNWRVGDKGLATDSWTLGAELSLFGIPWYVRAHRGPMNTLSNYTQRQDSLGFGLRLSGF